MTNPRSLGRIVSLLLVLQACARTDVFSDAQQVAIDPPEATVEFDRSAQFTAVTTPEGLDVEWTVSPEGAGTVSDTGIYRAPADTGVSEATVRVSLVSDERVFSEARITLVAQSTGEPDQFVKAGGDEQTATAGEPLAEPLRTRVIDADIVGVPGIVVRFDGVETVTNALGIATWTPTAQEASGTQYFEAATDGLDALTFSAEVVAGPAVSLDVSHASPTGVAGATMAIPAVVTLADTFGNPVVGQATTAAGPAESRADALDAVSDEAGQQRFSLTLAPAAGTQTFAFEAGELQATLDIEATAAVPALLQIESGNAQTQAVGSTLSEPLVVRLVDATGAPATTGTLTWTTPDGGQLKDAQLHPGSDGLARATFVLPPESGVVHVLVDAGDVVGSPATFTFVGTPGDATRLESVSGGDQWTTADQQFGGAFTVRATDAHANPVSDVLVYFEAVSGGGSVAPTSVQTDANGLAQATLTAGAAGEQVYRASSSGLAGSPIEISNTAIAVAPGLRLTLASGNNQTGVAGSDLESNLGVQVTNGSAPGAGYAVSFGVVKGSGSMRPTVVTTTTNGQANATARLGDEEGDQRFSASLPGAENSPIFFDAQALPKPVATLRALAGDGQTALLETPLASPFVLQALDAEGRPLPDRAIAFEALDGGSITPADATTDARGIASATATLGENEGPQRFRASAGDVTLTFQASATNKASGVQLLLVSGNGQSAQLGLELALPLSVRAVNTQGAPVADVSVNWSAESAQSSVSSATTKTDASGFAKVKATIGKNVGNQRFLASVDDPDSAPVVFLAEAIAAPAEYLELVSGDGQSAHPSSTLPSPFVVRATDRMGNPVAGVDLSFSPGTGGGSITPAAVRTNAAGEASATATLGAAAGAQTFHVDAANIPQLVLTATAMDTSIKQLSVSPAGKQLQIGASQRYLASALYANGTTSDVTEQASWSVADASVVSIGNTPGVKGRGEALKAGATSVKASLGGVSGAASVTVVGATLESMLIKPFDARMSRGSSRAFEATGTFADHAVASVTETSAWTSSDPAVATVSNTAGSKGTVRAVGTGTTTLTATSQGVSATREVTVSASALAHLEVSPPNVALPAGSTKSFQAFATHADGLVEDVTHLAVWSSSNTGLLTVDGTAPAAGTATFLAAGTASVQANWGGKTAAQGVRITNATVESIVIKPTGLTLSVPDFKQLRVIVTYSDGSIVDGQELAAWTTSDAAVADVSNAPGSRGVVTAVAQGTVKITATIGGESAEVEVEVDDRAYSGLSITPKDWRGNVNCVAGLTVSLSANANYSLLDAVDITERANWSSADTTLAIVENGVGQGGTVHCLEDGEVTITAAWRGESDTANLIINERELRRFLITPEAPKVGVGETRRLTATAYYGRNGQNGRDVTELATWSTSNTASATVSNAPGNKGALVGVWVGGTQVKASFEGVEDETTATIVSARLTKIVITPKDRSVGLFQNLQFKATAHYDNSTTADVTSQTQWMTSDPEVATIADNGRVNFNRSFGDCQVFATYSGHTDHTTLTISR